MMVGNSIIERLQMCFPNSFINKNGEFIAHLRTNQYFMLHNCETELDVKCKVLEWFSRSAYKTSPYHTKKKNDELHHFMLKGINDFLGTAFTEDDMECIYTYLGNAIKHQKTIEFVQSDYDMGFFKQFESEGQ